MGHFNKWPGWGLTALMLGALLMPASAQAPATVQVLEYPTLGAILADSQGTTRYLFTRGEENASHYYAPCTANGPPLRVEEGAEPNAGEGMIERAGGGPPRYSFVGDSRPGDTRGQGVGDSADTVAAPMAQPSVGLTEADGRLTVWESLLLMVVGGLVVAGGLAFARARRIR
jgi:predicted lipoprotein with Yx(FWY)xxD motif